MKRSRVTIGGLIGLIGACGVAFAALRAASALWAQAVVTTCLTALLIATVGALVASPRGPWVGFVIFGWSYFTLNLAPGFDENVSPAFLSSRALDELFLRIAPNPETPATTPPIARGRHTLASPFDDATLHANLRALAEDTSTFASPIERFQTLQYRRFRVIGHGVLAIVHGAFGAMLGAWLTRKKAT